MTVLVIKKVRDASVIPPFIQLVKWLVGEKNMVVYVESAVLDDPLLTGNPGFVFIKDKLMTFSEGKDDLTDKIDFIVCLGGDGTLLYASSLFQQSVPPVMAFHLGSLGFLTPFEVDNFEQQVDFQFALCNILRIRKHKFVLHVDHACARRQRSPDTSQSIEVHRYEKRE
jgi:NAD+ kinase